MSVMIYFEPIKLSICIPTYNRSEYLRECLDSVFVAVSGHEHEIEVVISDNASTDGTGDVVREFQKTYPLIHSHRNEQNIGAERNFYLLASLAQGENIWIFGDDDKMERNAVAMVLNNINTGISLTICNYSTWDKQFIVQKKFRCLPGEENKIYEDSNALIKTFGLHMGFCSSVVFKKSFFKNIPAKEHESFLGCGFPFVYSIYVGVVHEACKAGFIATPIVRNRGGNSGGYDWYKYFAAGSALIFNKLLSKGYTQNAVLTAKHKVLKDFVIPHMVHAKLQGDDDNMKKNIGMLFHHYNKNWIFWAVCVPVFLTPIFLARFVKNIRLISCRFFGMKS